MLKMFPSPNEIRDPLKGHVGLVIMSFHISGLIIGCTDHCLRLIEDRWHCTKLLLRTE